MQTSSFVITGIAAAAVLSSGCRRAETYQKPPTPVRTYTATRYLPSGSSEGGERYSASIRPAMQIDLAFKTGGYVSELHRVRGADNRIRNVQDGDFVAKGTVLARLRSDDFVAKVSQAESQLNEAQAAQATSNAQLKEVEAAFEQAQKDLDRTGRLLETRSITKPEYDAANTRHGMAQAKVEAARAQGGMMEAKISGAQALLSEAKLAQKDSVILAPMSCVVLRRNAEIGGLVGPGTPVFNVADLSTVKAVFGVPDTTVKHIRPGSVLRLSSEALPGVTFSGAITRVSPAADPRSRLFEVEISIPSPPPQLRPGMIASVELPADSAVDAAIVVPLNAIVRPKDHPESYAVSVVTSQDKKRIGRLRMVKLGEVHGNMIAVTEGLEAGEEVIISGPSMIADGEQVVVMR